MFRRIKDYSRFLFGLTRTNFKLIYGMWKLTKLPQPAITVFGGSRLPQDSPYIKPAFDLAKRLTLEGFSVITGGGPGIMEAANKGAYEAAKEKGYDKNGKKMKMRSLGITLSSFAKERLNPYIHDRIYMDHFFSRKWLLVRYSIGFIVFPGGFGTLDEFFEILTLVQCAKMPLVPIVLMDTEYWSPMLDWMENRALRDGLIDKNDINLIYCTDSVDDAFAVIMRLCKDCTEVDRPFYTQ